MSEKSKILVIVESPAKSKTISKYLGSDYIVRASYGHIFDLATTGVHNLGIDIDKGFVPKYKISSDKKDKVASIKKAAQQCRAVYIAADNDREGEAIAWHLAESLKSIKVPIRRVIFNEITKSAIKKSIQSPGDLNADLYDAQQARRVLDRIVGFCVSPILFNKFGKNSSAGRVQSVAVRIIADREQEIEDFKPEEYWNITTDLAKPKKTKDSFTAKLIKKVTTEKVAKKIKGELDNDTYVVFELEEKEKKRNPYPPLITSTLATTAAGRYKFSTSKTMKLAQSLYEAGLITYMRTDSVRCSKDSVSACRDWLGKNGHDCPTKSNAYASKGKAQDAHEAIRPTDVNVTPQNIYKNNDEQKIYRLIWERFIASQMKPAVYDFVSVVVKSSSGHLLKASGRTLKYKGWLGITGDFENEKNDDAKIPQLKVGDELVLVPPKVSAEQKFTQPPPRFSEKTLIKELEKRGIGRPSTYASIMSKITQRNYVEKKSNMFIPTTLGRQVVGDLVKNFKFMNINYTSNLELDLDKIADGHLKYRDMLDGFYSSFKKELKKAVLSESEDYGFKCPKCGGKMILKHGRFGFYLACYDYPKDCKGTISCNMVDGKPEPKGDVAEIADGVQCPNCGSNMVKRNGKFGPFYACVEYPKCKGTRKVPYGKQCPKCGSELYATIFRGNDLLFCMGYPNCKYSEKLPKGSIPNPQTLCKGKVPKKIKKILKK